MKPTRVDLLVDLAYGVVILLAAVLILVVGTGVGVAFGIGALLSYAIHVVWKMARFDPEWMTREMAEEVTENVAESVTEEVTADVAESVTEEVTAEVSDEVERTVTEELAAIVEQLERVNERIDRRPRADELDEAAAPDGEEGP